MEQLAKVVFIIYLLSGPNEGAVDLSSENSQLKLELNTLKKSLANAEVQVSELLAQVESIQSELTSTTTQLQETTSQMVDVQDKLDRVSEENEILRNAESECQSLKVKLDTLQRGGGGGPLEGSALNRWAQCSPFFAKSKFYSGGLFICGQGLISVPKVWPKTLA